MYNLSNLEPKFKKYLDAENISSVTLRNYLSDLRHFWGWLVSSENYDREITLEKNIMSIKSFVIDEYKNHHLKSSLPVKTINRRLSALRKFFHFCQVETLIQDNPGKKVGNISLNKSSKKLNQPTLVQVQNEKKSLANLNQNTKPIIIPKDLPQTFNLKHFLSITLMLISGFIFLYFKILKTEFSEKIPIFTTSQSPSRYLAFSGKLLDSLGNPITTKTDVTFRLYTQPVDGDVIYSTSCIGENGAITPDVNGETNILLGSDCDAKPLDSKIFVDNPNLYLGITVGSDSEMQPRQNIPNVGYALNSDKIQGLSIGNQTLSVPYINESGDLLIGTNNGAVRSTAQSSNFSISSAETVTIESSDIGDVILQATESGSIRLRTGGISDSYTRLTINNEGNIGIGTLFPTYGLEVNDDIKLTNGNRLILASSSSDPTGENGAMYYNMQSNKFRCYQNGSWMDCFGISEKNKIGGVYDGLINNSPSRIDEIISYLENNYLFSKNLFAEKFSSVNSNIQQLTTDSINSLTSNIQNMATNTISVKDKITSPIVETDRIEAKELKSKDHNITIRLNDHSQASTSEVNGAQENTSEVKNDKGPLASLIIKGLEGKTVASIDATGNASFSGQLASENLLVNRDATIAGSLRANQIESENITQLADKLKALEETTKVSTSEVNEVPENTSEVKSLLAQASDINYIQQLLADIKNEQLPNPQYYQNLDSDQYSVLSSQSNSEKPTTDNRQLITDLTVSDKTNLYDLSVTNSGKIGNLLIEDNSILSLAWDLKLSALANIKLFDEAVVISKDGNIRTKGKVIASAGVVTNKIEALNENENVSIKRLALSSLTIEDKYLSSASSSALIAAADNFNQNGISAPAIETKLASAGDAFIPQDSLEVIIYNSNVKDGSLIYLTPTTEILSSTLTISKKEACIGTPEVNDVHENTSGVKNFNCKAYFKVSTDSPTPSPLAFNWLIIN